MKQYNYKGEVISESIIQQDVITLSDISHVYNGDEFTADDIIAGYYLNGQTGSPTAKSGESMTPLIPCTSSSMIVGRHIIVCFYDDRKKFISGVVGDGSSEQTITTPSGAAFLRVSSKGLGSNTNLLAKVGTNYNTYITLKSNAYVTAWHYVDPETGVEWDDVIDRADVTKTLTDADRLNASFDLYDMILKPDVMYPYIIGAEYTCIPYSYATTPAYNFWTYNAAGEVIISEDSSRPDLGRLIVSPRNMLVAVDSTHIRVDSYISDTGLNSRHPKGSSVLEFDEAICFIKSSTYMGVNKVYKTTPDNLTRYHLATSGIVEGLHEQGKEYLTQSLIRDFVSDADELARRIKAEIIWQTNAMRHAIRLCTFNVGRNAKRNWKEIKELMQVYGVNIAGFQEVTNPLTDDDKGTFADYFYGWQFKNISDNGDINPINERMLATTEGYTIDSTEETFLGLFTDYRYVAKSVVSLPRYMDKRGSENLKMSVYNFQFEVSGSYAQNNAADVLNLVASDENPFVILMGDTNDFSNDKLVWKMFEDAGYTPIVGKGTSTTTAEGPFEVIDNFFVNSRIKPLGYDTINSAKYPFEYNGSMLPLSDHDPVFADVCLDYSDIHCITATLENASITISNGRTWMSDDETVTVTLTVDNGYSLAISSNDFIIRDAGAKIQSEVYSGDTTGGTITLVGSQLRGDVNIYAKAKVIS